LSANAGVASIARISADSPSLHGAAEGHENQSKAHDCFCCCSHLLAGQPLVLDVVASLIATPEVTVVLIPSRTIQTALDPPRLG
jgi:hypothetical protein